MIASYYSIVKFVNDIMNSIQKNFDVVHLSGNLKDTMYAYYLSPSEAIIEIPAKRYDIDKFLKNRIIVYTEDGSYAKEVNMTGGFSTLHTNYVDLAIQEAILQVANIYKLKVLENGN